MSDKGEAMPVRLPAPKFRGKFPPMRPVETYRVRYLEIQHGRLVASLSALIREGDEEVLFRPDSD